MHLQVDWDHEHDGSADRGIDVSSDILIVKGDIDPSSVSREIGTHFNYLINKYKA